MLERIAATVALYQMWHPGQKVGVAVSGGADSVCLLHLLRELAPRSDLRLLVLHLNHRLRGAESEEDAQFVRRLAAELGLAITVRGTEIAASTDNREQAGREARLAFFREVISTGQVDRVATGHTRCDQAETVLFRFLRGAGTAGLAGIRPVAAGIVRPLIAVDRSEVERFLRERGLAWREDSTNQSPEFARNRIRHDLLPHLEREWNPAIVRTLAQTADWALAEERYWEAEIDRLAPGLVPQNGFVLLRADYLRELPLAAARRLVRRAMELVKGDLRAIDFAHINAVLHMASTNEGHGRLQAPDLDIMRSLDWLRFGKPVLNGLETRNYRFPAVVPGVLRIPGEDFAISLELHENSESSGQGDYVYNGRMFCVDWERLSGALDLRNWRPGDQYQPCGRTGEEKIKTLFQEFRIPLWERRHWPVLIDGNSIVWARQFGPAARFASGPGTRQILRIREIGIGTETVSV